MSEIWRSVVNFEGYYEVSNLGSVRSVARIVKNYRGTAKTIGSMLGKGVSRADVFRYIKRQDLENNRGLT